MTDNRLLSDSPETDLDALLGELFALESQLNSAASDSLLLGMPALPASPARKPAGAVESRFSASSATPCAPPMLEATRRPVEPSPTAETPTTPIGQQPTSVHLPLTNGASRLAAVRPLLIVVFTYVCSSSGDRLKKRATRARRESRA